MAYKLTREAEDDIIHTYLEGVRLFGAAQAESYHRELEQIFELLAKNPAMARERFEITPPVRIHPHKAHIIVYLSDDANARGDILILRIRHSHEDWVSAPVS